DHTQRKVVQGGWTTLPLEEAPPAIIEAAITSCELIGNGLYGVDLKEKDGKVYVIEINDNPNVDTGVEDLVAKDEIYAAIMGELIGRIPKTKAAGDRTRLAATTQRAAAAG